MKNKVVVLLLTLVAGTPAYALDFGGIATSLKKSIGLGGPEYELTIEHPPAMPLKVTTVAIGKPEGECSDGVASRVEEDFVQAGVTVIDRQRFEDVMSEHKLQMKASFDQKTATRIGQLLGAQALLFIKVLDCHGGKNQKELYADKDGNRAYEYTVYGAINGSMKVVDLTSGKVLAAQRFEGNGEVKSKEGFPDPMRAMGEAEKTAAFSIHKLLLPWKESKHVVFYDDNQCDLKKASSLLKVQDLEGAMAQSEVNLAACKGDPKARPGTVARAYYNLGILQFMRDDLDAALPNLLEAQKLQDHKVFVTAITDCKRAKELALAMVKYEDEKVARGEKKPSKADRIKSMAPAAGSPKEAAASGAGASAAASVEDRLMKIEELKKKGLITGEEYKERRAKILAET